MSDCDALDERLRAVERALTDADDAELTDLRDAAELAREVDRLAARLDDAEDRLDELDAATQALRGYVGSVRSVNEAVERRADAALAKAEELEADLSERESEDGADRTPAVAESERVAPAERRPPSDRPHECRQCGRAVTADADAERRDRRRGVDGRPERSRTDAGQTGDAGRVADLGRGDTAGRADDPGLLARVAAALTGAE